MYSTRIDLTGQIFERLTVVEFVQLDKDRNSMWRCLCECGNEVVVRSNHLRSGRVKSCGCLNAELSSYRRKSHGESYTNATKEYRAWQQIKGRCYRKTHERYEDYGGRGITVCQRWLDSYKNFLEDMGRAPTPEHSIERKKNHLGYSKENCKWATDFEQANNKRNNHYLEHKGEVLTLSQWERKLNMKPHTLKYFINVKQLTLAEVIEIKKIVL